MIVVYGLMQILFQKLKKKKERDSRKEAIEISSSDLDTEKGENKKERLALLCKFRSKSFA